MDSCLTLRPPLYLRARWALQSAWARFAAYFAKEEEPASRADVNARAAAALDEYGNAILRYAYSFLHNMADAEEVLQDTLLQMLKAAPEFQSAEHEKAWLLRVAGNLSRNRIAYNRVRSADELNEQLAAEGREDLSFVWEAVKQLPERQRAVIHLFYREGYQTRDIARILGRNEATVRSDLRRARERLRTVLKEEYDFETPV